MAYQRSELLATSYEILRKKGLEKLSVRELANALGSSTIVVYSSFGSKESLLAELASFSAEKLHDKLSKALSAKKNTDKLWALTESLRDFAKDEPEIYRLIFSHPNPAWLLSLKSLFILATPNLPAADQHYLSWIGLVHGLIALKDHGLITDKGFAKNVLKPALDHWKKNLS